MKIKILFGLLAVFVTSAIFLTIETATVGSENAFLENKTSDLLIYKKKLENEFVKVLSMSKLEDQSIASGFVKPSEYMYINSDEQVASLR